MSQKPCVLRMTPTTPWLPILLIHTRSQVKTRQSHSYKFENSPNIQILEFCKKHCTRHTFWSCWIRCVNMKWIPLVLWKLQSGHDSVHRRTDRLTDGRRETSTPPFNFVEAQGIITKPPEYQQDITLHKSLPLFPPFFPWYVPHGLAMTSRSYSLSLSTVNKTNWQVHSI